MGRLHKCRKCGKTIPRDSVFKVPYGKTFAYFCSEDEAKEFEDKHRKEMEELPKWDALYKYVKFEIMGYKENLNLPKYLIQRLKDLRDGVNFQMEIGRIQSTKEGYPFEVILGAFKGERNTILNSFKTKQFKNERQQINYMMAIIESKLNDYYAMWENYNKAQAKIQSTEIDDAMQYDNINQPTKKEERVDLSSFLD